MTIAISANLYNAGPTIIQEGDMITTTGQCDQCEAVMFNGMRCHETGCPDAWVDYTTRDLGLCEAEEIAGAECQMCGCDFKPDERSIVCSQDCAEAYFS